MPILHDPKVGETWRYGRPDHYSQPDQGEWTDFLITHFAIDGVPHGRVVARSAGDAHTVGQEQGLSIKHDSVAHHWRRVTRDSETHAPSAISHEVIRSVRIWPPTYDGPSNEWTCDVRLDWCKDETDAERMEHGIGATPEEAYERACLIAAAFMAVPIPVGRDDWPANGIDIRELV